MLGERTCKDWSARHRSDAKRPPDRSTPIATVPRRRRVPRPTTSSNPSLDKQGTPSPFHRGRRAKLTFLGRSVGSKYRSDNSSSSTTWRSQQVSVTTRYAELPHPLAPALSKRCVSRWTIRSSTSVTVLELHTPADLECFGPAFENGTTFDVSDAVDDAHASLSIHGEAATQLHANLPAGREVDGGECAVQVLGESKTSAKLVRQLDSRKPIRLP